MYIYHIQGTYSYTVVDCNTCISEFFISSYGTTLAERASYFALHSSLFAPDGAVNYDYIVTNSINWLKMYSQWHTH